MRWAVPAAVAGAAALLASGVFSPASSTRSLPDTTPAALLAQLGSQPVTTFSGTVVSHVSLGLPDLPSIDDVSSASPLADLLTGSRTLQVWYGGRDKQRIALLGATDETDLFRSGRTLWRWDSADRVADRVRLAADHDRTPASSTLTPAGMTAAALASLKSSTQVSVESGADVADRAAYELVLRPRSEATRIGEVRIAIDGQTKVPLAVQVYPRGSTSPAIDVSYTSIRYAAPSGTNFHFAPPAGARVRHLSLAHMEQRDGLTSRFALSGSGWSGVAGYAAKRDVSTRGLGLGRALTAVSGTWGRGRLLQTSLGCILVTHNGRIYAGAVDPSVLYAAAARR